MDEWRRRSLRQCGVWIAALAGHALLLLLLVHVAGPPDRKQPVPAEQPTLVMLDLDRPVAQPVNQPDLPRRVRAALPPTAERRRFDDVAAPSTVITEPAAAPPIDWANEASIAARAATAISEQPATRDFDADIKPGRSRCEKQSSSFEWHPEPKRAGFAGILPYVRLGRCVVGLGFFGCPIGEPPEPNSHLFDDMKKADRPVSSVPDVDRCD